MNRKDFIELENANRIKFKKIRFMMGEMRTLHETKEDFYFVIEKWKNVDTEVSSIETLFQFLQNDVRQVLTEKDFKLYKDFLRMFSQLWEYLYFQFCSLEKNCFDRQEYSEDIRWSIGIDELTDERYEMGIYEDLFMISQKLSRLVSGGDPYYIIDSHLAIITKFMNIDILINPSHIYKFKGTSRLKKWEEEYYEQFHLELSCGMRESIIVDQQEKMAYIFEKAKEYNVLLLESSKIDRKI